MMPLLLAQTRLVAFYLEETLHMAAAKIQSIIYHI
jgi:hypothetical protein